MASFSSLLSVYLSVKIRDLRIKKSYNIGPRSPSKHFGCFTVENNSGKKLLVNQGWDSQKLLKNFLRSSFDQGWYLSQELPGLLKLIIMEQVASNKSSLLLKNILHNTQTLQLDTMIVKTECSYKSN